MSDVGMGGYSAAAIANAFILVARRAGKGLTHLQLQKLVYIAQGIALVSRGRPLFYNDIEAWRHGPVIRDLYRVLRDWRDNEVTRLIPVADDDEVSADTPAEKVVRAVYKVYGDKGGWELSGITHQEGSPWYVTRKRGERIIGVGLMRDKFKVWSRDEDGDE